MMYNYVDNFFRKTNASYVERYSDSSDFEYPTNIPPVTAKRGNHVLLNEGGYYASQRKDPSQIETFNKNLQVERDQLYKKQTKRLKKMIPTHQSKEAICFDKHMRLLTDRHGNEYFKNRGDQSSRHNFEKISSKSLLRDKVLPRLSTIFRRSNYTKQMATAEEKQHIVTQNNDQNYCVDCERRRLKKLSKRRRYNAIQPNYAVVGNIHEAPIRFNQTGNPDAPLSHNSMTRKQSNTRCCISSSGSDVNVSQEKPIHDSLRSNSKNKKDKKLQYEYHILNYDDYYEEKRHKHLQYPSKHYKPYEVYTNTSCQAKNQSFNNSMPASKMESSSSSFWEYVAERIKAKNKKPCSCEPEPPQCNLDSCEILNSPRTSNRSNERPMAPKFRETGETLSTPTKMKSNQVECKCNKTKSLNQDTQPTCQEPHDALTQHLADKYKGHILCIHNPPCILINGCLNLPQPKTDGASNVWRVTQSKRTSYREDIKPEYTEDACQYQPPITLPECLPEFQTEKIVQSICNHDPPCEVVHGCYKPKYDAKLQNSCVHVPMCQKLPECMIKEGQPDAQSVGCGHNPKCNEVPLCSKKFLVLTARENTSTQVKPKMKMVCRHEPQCLMIPKCIGRVICSETVPYDAIPDCVHHPCCEMIPACCRKAAKEMVSVTCQYPYAPCRIV